jgi:hypothetical protein
VQDIKQPEWRALSENRSSSSVPRVKYLPQRYFEELCNDHVKGDDSLLQGELRTVIFSHIPVEERDGADSFDELIGLRTDVIEREASGLQASLKTINARIIQLTEQVNQAARDRARESVWLALVGLHALHEKKPKAPPAPQADGRSTRHSHRAKVLVQRFAADPEIARNLRLAFTSLDATPQIHDLRIGQWGIFSTHADNAVTTFSRITDLVKGSEVGRTMDYSVILKAVQATVDVVIHMADREVTEIYYDPVYRRKMLAGAV